MSIAPPPPVARPTFIGSGSAVAVVTVVLVAALLVPSPHVPGAMLVATAAGYLLSTTAAVAWAERAATDAPMAFVLAAQVALGLSLMSVSGGTAAIGVMPTISMAVLYRSLRAGVGVATLFTLCLLALAGTRGMALLPTVAACAGFVAAATFVITFSRFALGERVARASVERLAAELEVANRRLSDYAAQVEEVATAKERNRIAREIHDNLGHCLTAVNVQIEAGRAVLANGDAKRALACLGRAQSLTQEGLADVRRAVAVLRAPLRDAIATLVDDCRTSGLEGALTIRGSARPLPPRVEFSLYRAVQEALTNVRRHAKASRIDVTLTVGADDVALVIADDGVGTSAPPDGRGFGLLGLQERVRLLGGRVTIRTAPHEGFALEIWVPG